MMRSQNQRHQANRTHTYEQWKNALQGFFNHSVSIPSFTRILWGLTINEDDWKNNNFLRAGVISGLIVLAIYYFLWPFAIKLYGSVSKESTADIGKGSSANAVASVGTSIAADVVSTKKG